MKNQNDLIITIVVIVLALITAAVLAFTGPKEQTAPMPTKVNLEAPKVQGADVRFVDALPGGSTNSGGGGAAGRGGAGAAGGGGGRPASTGGGGQDFRPAGVQGAN